MSLMSFTGPWTYKKSLEWVTPAYAGFRVRTARAAPPLPRQAG